MTDGMIARGRVLASLPDGRLAVELDGREACPGCRCGRLALARGRRTVEIAPGDSMTVCSGDEILLTMPTGAVLRGAIWLHGVPWGGTLTGAAAGAAVGLGDLGCFAGALIGLAAGLLILRRCQRRWHDEAATDLRIAPIA